MSDMTSGRVTHVLVYDQDRLVRDPRELEDIVEAVEAGGVFLTSVNGDIDLLTDNGKMVARIKGAVARNELDKISRRVKRQQLQHAEAGKKHQGSHRVFGYDRDFAEVESEADAVREIYRRKAAGESLTSIAADLNDRGIRTVVTEIAGGPRAGQTIGGNTWDASLLSRLVRRRDYIAEVTIKGEVVGAGNWKPLVGRDTWLLANDEVERHHNRGKRARRSLLAGFMVCGTCLTKMKQGGAKDEQRYNCPSGRAIPGACGSCSITQPKTDTAVFNAVWRKEQDSVPPKPSGPRRNYLAEEESLQADLDQTHELRKSGELALIDAVPILNDIRAKLAQVQREAALDVALDLGHAQMVFDWPEWNLSQKRVWLDRYISYVVISKANPALPKKGFKPDRIEIHYLDGSVEQLSGSITVASIDTREPVPPRVCSMDGCEKAFYSKSLCHRHYRADYRHRTAAPQPLEDT